MPVPGFIFAATQHVSVYSFLVVLDFQYYTQHINLQIMYSVYSTKIDVT